MERIKLRLKIFGILSVIAIVSIALLFYCYLGNSTSTRQINLIIILLNLALGICLLLLSYHQYYMLRRAQLIIENKLIHIPAAKASDVNKCIDIYLSCFGMLLGDKMIPFDVGKEIFQSMTIDDSSVIIVYGGGKNKKTIQFNKNLLPLDDFNDFTVKLEFETGIKINQTK